MYFHTNSTDPSHSFHCLACKSLKIQDPPTCNRILLQTKALKGAKIARRRVKENMDEKEMVREKGAFGEDEVGESETESLQDKERAHLQYVEMANGNDTKEALTDISMVSTIFFIATIFLLLE